MKVHRDRFYNYKGKLLTWSQRRCEKCQRFLAKHQQIFCSKCAPKEHQKGCIVTASIRYHRDSGMREYAKLRCRIYQNAGRFNVGDIV